MSHSNLANCAVTDEGSEAEYVSNDGLIVRFAEHKRDELAYTSQQHRYLRCSLGYILETAII